MIPRIILLTTLISMSSYSQPYYYYEKDNPNGEEKPGGYSIDIYRLNLATNNNEPFLIDAGRVNGPVFFNKDQSKVFFQVRFSLMAVDVNDASRHPNEILEGVNETIEIKDSPAMNRYYIPLEDIEGNLKTIVLDRQTLKAIDTIYEKYTEFGNLSAQYSFLSQDEKSLYQLEDDSTGIYFSEYLVEQKQQRNPQRLGNMGPFLSFPYQRDSKIGYALVSFASMDINLPGEDPYIMNKHYVVCNMNKKEIYTPIKFPWNSEGHLAPTANYILLEQRIVDWSQPDGKYHTGNISVFNAQSGQLMQRLQLPPNGKILMFDNYPDKLFYLTGTDGNFQSIQVSLDVITPVLTLIDTLIALTNQSYQQNLIGEKNFVKELTKKLDDAKKHLTKKHANTKDSINCAKKVKEFQENVEEVYKETTKQEKEHGKAKREEKFVTVEGWKFLYYNAQYILDRLPAIKKEKGEEE